MYLHNNDEFAERQRVPRGTGCANPARQFPSCWPLTIFGGVARMGFSAIFEALGVGVVVVLICLLLRTLFSFILGLRYIEGSGKVVVVTGCDTGFGRGVALKLDKLGFYVIAACLTEAAVKELNSFLRGRGRAIRCDITSANDVREVESVVTSLCTGSLRLHALVNNAGIHEGFAVEFTSVAEYQHVLDVNCLGGIRVTQALLPLLAPNRGRVVNVTSAAAFVSLPLMSAYNVSKFGFTAFTDALRREMLPFHVSVSSIHPGFFATPMVTSVPSVLQRCWDRASPELKSRYGTEFFRNALTAGGTARDLAGDPTAVVNAICHAVASAYPKSRYRIRYDSHLMYFLAMLPSGVADWLILTGQQSIRALRG